MPRLLKRLAFIATAVALISAGLLIAFFTYLHFTGGEWTDDRIKKSSPFHRFVEPFERKNEDDIKAYVLKELPIGSEMSSIMNFVDRHFVGCEMQKQTGPLDVAYSVANPAHLSFRLWESGIALSGSDYMDLILVLDHSDHLLDVIVSCNGDWL